MSQKHPKHYSAIKPCLPLPVHSNSKLLKAPDCIISCTWPTSTHQCLAYTGPPTLDHTTLHQTHFSPTHIHQALGQHIHSPPPKFNSRQCTGPLVGRSRDSRLNFEGPCGTPWGDHMSARHAMCAVCQLSNSMLKVQQC